MTIKPRKLPYNPVSPLSLAPAFKHRPHRPVVTILAIMLLAFGLIVGISKPDTLSVFELIFSGMTLVVLIVSTLFYLIFDLVYRLRKGQIVSVYFNDDYQSARLSITDGKGGYIEESIPYEDFSFQSIHFPSLFVLKNRSVWTFERAGQKLGTVDSAFVAWQGELYLLRKLNRKLRKMRDTQQEEEDHSHLLPKAKQQSNLLSQKVSIP